MAENIQLEPSLTRLIRATLTDYIDELIAKNDEQKSKLKFEKKNIDHYK
jgi:hypothetical protein